MEKKTKIFNPEFKQIVSDLPGAEGPVFNADGTCLYMVAPEVEVDGKPAGQILKVDEEKKEARVLCCPAVGDYGGIPAGCQIDSKGDLWVADMRLGVIQVNAETGECQQVCKRDFAFHPMQGCNDCAFDSYGNLWISAPAGQIAPAPYTRSMQEAFGSLYCYDVTGVMTRIDTGYKFPNGVAVQYDKSGTKPEALIVAETPTKTLWRIPFKANEKVGVEVDMAKKEVFGHCPGHHEGGPDGMDFDCEGNLLVANWGSGFVEVFNRFGGRPHTRIELPFKNVSNLHFKPGTKEVFITEHSHHGLWKFEWIRQGAKQFCELALAAVRESLVEPTTKPETDV